VNGRFRSVASRKTDQSSPEVGRMDFPSFRLDRKSSSRGPAIAFHSYLWLQS